MLKLYPQNVKKYLEYTYIDTDFIFKQHIFYIVKKS